MQSFIFEIAKLRVLFGPGRRHDVAAELDRLDLKCALVIADPSQRAIAEHLHKSLGERSAGIYDKVVQHVPHDVAAAGTEHARAAGADCTVCIGGGSSIGLGKAIALEAGLPLIALPTTYAGSEMTPVWGLTTNGEKRTGRDPRVQPVSVIYDAELTSSLPPAIAGPSGINALAHAVEGLWAENVNPMMAAFAQESVRALVTGLPKVVENGSDLDAQSTVQYGTCLAGILLASVGMALHHKICHTLGGTFNTPHAETHAVILPYVTAFNLAAADDARRRLEAALGQPDDVALALWKIAQQVGAPKSLADLGLSEADLERAADMVTRNPYYNPRPVTYEAVLQLLRDAHAGVPPSLSSAA
ncbi:MULTISPECIES: maleylacetate reductase [Pseudomonas]|uniref:maleylacetate reductase n=1 Tax=Pseudomonas TaxID=286 RepID=UPI00398FD6EA